MSKNQTYLSWGAQIIAAAILAIAMVPKFTSAPEAIDTFTTLGVEPWGRYVVAIMELLAVVLLLAPLRQYALGALVAVGLMVGAIASHAWRLGFSGAAAAMTGMAVVVLIAGLIVVYIRRQELPLVGEAPRDS